MLTPLALNEDLSEKIPTLSRGVFRSPIHFPTQMSSDSGAKHIAISTAISLHDNGAHAEEAWNMP